MSARILPTMPHVTRLPRLVVLGLPLVLAPLGLGCQGDEALDEAESDHGPVFVAEADALLDQLTPTGDGWAQAPTFTSEEAFRRIGIRFDAQAMVDIQARFSDDGENWGEWSPLTLTYEDQIAHNAHVDAPFPATAAQVRFLAPVEAQLSFAAIELIEYFVNAEPEGEGAIDVEAAGSAEQGLAADGIVVTRAQWGARQRNCSGSHSPNKLTIHHTDTPNNDSLSMPARVRQIQAYHIDNRGWCDIGYHFLIGQDGQVYQGRPENKIGAHAAGANTNNVGISFIGDFSSVAPSQGMLNAAARIMDAMFDTYGIARDRARVKGHREVGTTSTTCPGNQLFARLSELITLSTTIDGSGPPPVEDPGNGGGGLPEPGCYSSTLGQNVDSGACVQVSYAGCGLGSCAWYACAAGSWQCINRDSCDDDASFANAACAPAEPAPEPEPPTGAQCYSSTLGENVEDGSCVQVTYAGCGENGCQWYRCNDGAWQCTDRNSCDDDLARENAGCAQNEPPPPAEPTPVAGSYSDLPSSHWAFQAAESLRTAGAMWGCAPGLFCPDQLVTRAEVAYLFAQLDDAVVQIPIDPIFNDVGMDDWMFNAVQEMAVREISSGCGNGNFCPWDGVSRAAAAVFLRRASGLSNLSPSTPTFVDVPSSHWAYSNIERMVAEGVIVGCSENPRAFCPGDMMTRAEAAVLFARAYQD